MGQLRVAFDAFVNLRRAFVDQEQTAADQDQIAPRERLACDGEQRFAQVHDPGKHGQQGQTRPHGQNQTDPACDGLPFARQAFGEDGEEDKVVDPQDDFHDRQGQQADPDLGVGERNHPRNGNTTWDG